jgi:hypothetical protein
MGISLPPLFNQPLMFLFIFRSTIQSINIFEIRNEFTWSKSDSSSELTRMKSVSKQWESSIGCNKLKFYRKIIFWWRVPVLRCILSERADRFADESHCSRFISIFNWLIFHYQTVIGSKPKVINNSKILNCVFISWSNFLFSQNVYVAQDPAISIK